MKHKEKKEPEFGSFRYAGRMGVKNPVEFYHMRLEYLKRKRKEKYDSRLCCVCGDKAMYVNGYLKKKFYCEKCKVKEEK